VYPFDFSSVVAANMQLIVKIAFILGSIGTVIGIMAESTKLAKKVS
jgi:hypothetical protein